MIKIFHFADLHLDSPFSGSDIKRSEEGRERQRGVFRRMMAHIRETGYDLVLIAGDLYDCGFVTEETAALVTRELSSLSCPVVIAPGNHDPFIKGSLYSFARFGENVHIFENDKLSRFDFAELGVSVYGYAFTGNSLRENPLSEAETSGGEKIKLLCAHTEVGNPLSLYAPTTYADIERAGFSYAALGHIHKAPEPFISGSLVAAYPGMPEGRAFDETENGGALALTVFETGEETKTTFEKLNFAEYSYEIEQLDISYATCEKDVEDRIELAIAEKKYSKKTAVRFILRGVVDLGFSVRAKALEEKFSRVLDLAEIKDETVPLLGSEALESDPTVRGEFYRILKEKMENGTAEERATAALAFKIGLSALEGRDLSVFMPSTEIEENTEVYDEDTQP